MGGFPCLGFTIANGKNRNLNSHYNALYLQFVRILKIKMPQVFLVENVVGINAGEAFKNNFKNEILKSFENCGYKVKFKVLNASDFLVPQNRKRVIILDVRNDINLDIDFPKPFNIKISLKDAICDLPDNFSKIFPNHIGSNHAVKINGYVGNRQLKWDSPSPTITGRGSRGGGAVIHPHPNLRRRLSIRECARIQSFPDNFIFYGSNSACYAHIGNAVAPLFSFFIANEFRKFFKLHTLEPYNFDIWSLPYLKKVQLS